MPVPFKLLLTGSYRAPALRIRWSNRRRTPIPEVAHLIAETWTTARAEAARHGRDLFPGAMTRLRGWSAVDATLTLDLGPTDYREFVGTNLRHPELADRFGRASLANPLGVSVAVVTSDGHLIVQRRSEQVFEYPGFFHVCGGNVEPADVAGRVAPGVFATVRRELDEEFGIAPGDVLDLICLGLAENRAILKPDLLVAASVALPADAFVSSRHPEFSALTVIEGAEALAAFLVEHATETSPAGLACLFAVGRHRYGEGWYEETMNNLGVDL
jgi:8-oxo-dGTP pyrophosphatase MutT (NUDIX family)